MQARTPDHRSSDALSPWREAALRHTDLTGWMQSAANDDPSRALLETLFSHSPYLSRLALAHPGILKEFQVNGAEVTLAALMDGLRQACANISQSGLMKELRLAKQKISLLAACADIGGKWPLERVTRCLSDLADAAVALALNHILKTAHASGEIVLPVPEEPQKSSGIIILGMGKLGAHELNYSSDIDLIVFYAGGRLAYRGRQSEQHFMNRLCRDLVHILETRDANGYVFRTDLRLRPDPASTPPAVSVDAALYYYESVGQNWERAAMIKARAIAGDEKQAEDFRRRLVPFIWRRHLDFAAIDDIQSIKRQMDRRSATDGRLSGYNVKLGAGGIREIEFTVQVYQLIWGGREPSLRLKGTCETLARLQRLTLIDADAHRTLERAYVFLRTLEHRLQMVEDRQTHSLPESEEGLRAIAAFMGYADLAAFGLDFFTHTQGVHALFTSSFKGEETLGAEGSLVFTGVSPDPDTLETLRKLGFHAPEAAASRIMGWHHGVHRCTRTRRARELITELTPALLKAFGETAGADTALAHFDAFLSRLPSGVQLFSLFAVNPHLLQLVADIMGSAPTLAETLSRHPDLIEAVLLSGFYDRLPGREALDAQLKETLAREEHVEARLDALRRFKNERQFQAGVQLLKQMICAEESGVFLSQLAETLLEAALAIVQEEFAKTYGHIEGARFCVLALGRLGASEMHFASDLDLVFVYDAPDTASASSGEKRFTSSVYYNRFAQRMLSGLSLLSRQGMLYAVDTRLRPSGEQGPLATSYGAFKAYFDTQAWTFEVMALTKARAVAGNASFRRDIEACIAGIIARPRMRKSLAEDVRAMRERIAREHPPANPWDIKYAQGGLIEVDFTAEALCLLHAHTYPSLAHCRNSAAILKEIARLGIADTSALLGAHQFLNALLSMLRLSAAERTDFETAAPGLKALLARAVGLRDFEGLKITLQTVESTVREAYNAWVTP